MRQENNYLETLTDRTELFLSSVFGLQAAYQIKKYKIHLFFTTRLAEQDVENERLCMQRPCEHVGCTRAARQDFFSGMETSPEDTQEGCSRCGKRSVAHVPILGHLSPVPAYSRRDKPQELSNAARNSQDDKLVKARAGRTQTGHPAQRRFADGGNHHLPGTVNTLSARSPCLEITKQRSQWPEERLALWPPCFSPG